MEYFLRPTGKTSCGAVICFGGTLRPTRAASEAETGASAAVAALLVDVTLVPRVIEGVGQSYKITTLVSKDKGSSAVLHDLRPSV